MTRPHRTTGAIAAAIAAAVCTSPALALTSGPVGPMPLSVTSPNGQQLDQEASPVIERTPLGQPAASALTQQTADDDQQGPHWLTRTAMALAVVLALIFALRYATTKIAARTGSLRNQLGAAGRAPQGILYVVARYPVARNQTLVLLQINKRLILTAQSSAGFQTLAEITDPAEIADILTKADDAKGTSAAARFKHTLTELERDPAMLDSTLPDPRTPAQTPPATGASRPAQIVEEKPPAHTNATIKQYLRKLREAAE